jgi:hypothetical protein
MGESRPPVARAALDERSDTEEQVFRLIEQSDHPLVGDLVVHELPPPLPPDQPALGQTRQVHGHIGLAQARPGDNTTHRKRTVPERIEDTKPRRVSQSSEQLGPEGDARRKSGSRHIS